MNTLREIAIATGSSIEKVRESKVPFRHTRGDSEVWEDLINGYDSAVKLVNTTCESIDSIAERLELDIKTLIKHVCGEKVVPTRTVNAGNKTVRVLDALKTGELVPQANLLRKTGIENTHSLRTAISKLRKRGYNIQNIRGEGYVLQER